MSEAKTRPTGVAVDAFLAGLPEPQQADSRALIALMREVTGEEPRMWGPSIVGFGSYHYRYATGREGDAPLTSFSPRKQNLTVYLSYGFEEQEELLARLGKHKLGKACLYVKRLADVDQAALRELVQQSVDELRRTNA